MPLVSFNGVYINKEILITGETGFKGGWLPLRLSPFPSTSRHGLGQFYGPFDFSPNAGTNKSLPGRVERCGALAEANSGISRHPKGHNGPGKTKFNQFYNS